MSDLEVAKRGSQAEVITQCAAACENAVVGIISSVLSDDALDKELQQLRHDLLARTHRLRQIAIEVSKSR